MQKEESSPWPEDELQGVNKVIQRVKHVLRGFVKNEAGLETVECAIITGRIVAATIAVIFAIGAWVLSTFQTVQTAVGA